MYVTIEANGSSQMGPGGDKSITLVLIIVAKF